MYLPKNCNKNPAQNVVPGVDDDDDVSREKTEEKMFNSCSVNYTNGKFPESQILKIADSHFLGQKYSKWYNLWLLY